MLKLDRARGTSTNNDTFAPPLLRVQKLEYRVEHSRKRDPLRDEPMISYKHRIDDGESDIEHAYPAAELRRECEGGGLTLRDGPAVVC